MIRTLLCSPARLDEYTDSGCGVQYHAEIELGAQHHRTILDIDLLLGVKLIVSKAGNLESELAVLFIIDVDFADLGLEISGQY